MQGAAPVADNRAMLWADPGTLLIAALLVPPLLTLLARERALRGPGDRTGRWFTFARRAQSLMLWGSLGWLLLASGSIAPISRVARSFGGGIPFEMAFTIGAVLLPVVILPVWVGLISHDVSRRLETTEIPWRDVLKRLGWWLVGVLLPILGLAFGAFLAGRGQILAFLLVLIAGIVAGCLCLSRHQRMSGMVLHSITHGELRDRLFELAARAQVKLDQLYVLPMKKMNLANAFAVDGQRVYVTDLLLERLTRDEVDAILAHEVAHLRLNHPRKLALAALGFGGLPFAATISFGWGWALCATWLGLLVVYAISRRIERTADAQALRLGVKPHASISGLVRLAQLSHVPIRWNRWTGWMLTHPSIEERAWAIGKAGDVPDHEIARLLEGGESPREAAATSHYSVHPAGDPDERVFSTPFKTGVITRNSLVLLTTALLVPAAVFTLARWWNVPHLVALAAALLAGPGTCLVIVEFLSVQPLHRLAPRLARRVGLDARWREAGWELTGLAPHRESRIYEGFTNWDLGFARVAGGRLEFVGEETRFALPPDRIVRVELVSDTPSWIRTEVARLAWRDDDGMVRELRLSPAGGPGLSSITAGSRKLAAALARPESSAGRTELSGLDAMTLPLPPRGEITSRTPRSLVRAGLLVHFLVLDLVLGTLVGLIYLLPLVNWLEVVGIAFATQIFLVLPAWRHRDSASAAEPPREEYRRAA